MPLLPRVTDIVDNDSYYIRNEHRGPTTYTHGHANTGELYRWGPAGDPDQEDVQAVPGYVLKSPGFQRVLSRGLFTLVDESSASVHISEAGDIWQQQQKDSYEAITDLMDDSNDGELVEGSCMGPGIRGTGQLCGQKLFIRKSALETQAPLCGKHEKFASYFAFDNGAWGRIPTKTTEPVPA